tara:strand:+ start:1893 stop:2138 length:246 start_codon:yes stop_codon:yes gene_type:complete
MWKEPTHFGEYVILKRRKDTTHSGIIVANKAENIAVVVSAKNLDKGTLVVFGGEQKFTHKDIEYLVTHENAILAILGTEDW